MNIYSYDDINITPYAEKVKRNRAVFCSFFGLYILGFHGGKNEPEKRRIKKRVRRSRRVLLVNRGELCYNSFKQGCCEAFGKLGSMV